MTRPTPAALAASVLMAALLVLAWWLPNQPRLADMPMPVERFNSVSFAPFRAGHSPLTNTFPTAAEVEEDMALVAQRSRGIRTYASIEGNYEVAEIAAKHGLKVWKGAWLGTDRVGNRRELARLIEIANKYPDTVERVIVGNEVLLRRDLSPAELSAAIREVKAAVRQPVTYADVWEFWEQFPEIAQDVDIITIHILPYWEDHPLGVDAAMAHTREVYRRMRALFPDKPISIGEAGWPSRGRWRQDAAPSRVNQASFVRQFAALAEAEHFDWNLIEAFDQVWKARNEGSVGANWGLWTADRQVKFPLSGPVVEDPDWASRAGTSVLLGALLAFMWCRRVPPSGQPAIAVLGFALAGALVYASAGTAPLIYDAHQAVAAALNLLGQTLLVWLMMQRASLIVSGEALPPPPTGAETTALIRNWLCLRREDPRAGLIDHLFFVFLWTAALLQVLLVVDPRYRDFPLPTFAVPLVVIAARALLRDLPRGGGGREEWMVGLVLVVGAVASAVIEGPLNLQSLVWNAAALVLAIPPLLRAWQPAGRERRAGV